MDRRGELLKHITKNQKGIEIGPWFAPLAPKREGYNCLSFDVFDTDTLKKNAERDPCVDNSRIASIEAVDIVGSSTEIYDAVSTRGELSSFDYILSSHNFEHLPNPIKFLQGSERVLKPGGRLSMAVPDKRTCFDYFRPVSTLASWLEAYIENRSRPTPAQSFEQNSLHCRYWENKQQLSSFSIDANPNNITSERSLQDSFNALTRRKRDSEGTAYFDTHCWTFTPSSLKLLLSDISFLKLISLTIEEVSEVNGNEFYVHLRRDELSGLDESEFYAQRQLLLHSVMNEIAYNSMHTYGLRAKSMEQAAEIGELREELSRKEQSLRAIRASLTWKLASPLWRLETRSARKRICRRSPN